MPVDDGTEEELDKGVWLQLCDVLNGQGQGQHAHLLQKDGRFRTREGGRYTLYRATGKLNGAEQDICVIVRIDMDGHVTARRIIVSLKQPLVLFVNEERDESPDCPKGISKEQATNTDPSGLHPMPSTAVMLLRYKLMQATRAGNL